MKQIFILFLFSFCLIISVAVGSANETLNKEKTNLKRSQTVGNISFTLDDYSIKDNKLMVNYSVEGNGNYKMDPGGLIERPDVFIAGKLTHPHSQTEKKINAEKYVGSAEINLPSDLPKQFDIKFNTDAILNQTGQWTIDFKVK